MKTIGSSVFTIVKLIVIIAAIVALAVISITEMTTSYAEYKVYYDALMAEKEYNKYIDSLPFSFDGISVELNDKVTYYATGKAYPKKGDFIVTAHFSEKGKETNTILSSTEFEIYVPDDFSTNGGKVTVKYVYQPEKALDATEDPRPIIKTAEIDLSLEPVVLTGLELVSNPYRVHYSDEMSFDADGIELLASFNCGETAIITASDIKVAGGGALTTGTNSVKVSYTNADVTLETEVPVTVQAAAEYDEGDIIGIRAEGSVSVRNGQSISNLEPNIRATYDNGNRLLIPSDEYTVSSNVATATFYNNCILSIALKDNPIINCRMSATVVLDAEAENATANGGTKNSAGSVTFMEGFANGNTLTYSINSSEIAKAKTYIRVANNSDKAVNLGELVTLTVNGKVCLISGTVVVPAGEYLFIDCALPDIIFNKGDNVLKLTFGGNAGELAVDKLVIETEYDGIVFSNMDEYLINNMEQNNNPDFIMDKIIDFHTVTNGTYIHGMCTDGTYVYATRTVYSSGLRALLVTKHRADNFELVATSPRTAAGAKEANAGITYYDGKIIVYFEDGTEWCIDSSLAGQWTEYTGFTFEGLDGVGLRDVYYNNETQHFAVLAGTTISIFSKDMKLATSFTTVKETGGNIMRMSGSSDYLYFVFSKDGVYQPIVHMYSWSGEFIGRVVVPNGADVVGSDVNLAKTNVQGMVAMNDDLYFAFLRFAQGNGNPDGVAIIKASYPQIDGPLTYSLTVGEYIDACVNNGKTPVATARPAFGSNGRINATGNYAMAGISDGEYIYLSVNTLNNLSTIISKYDPIANKIIAESISVTAATEAGDNSKIFIKDGVLYCIVRDGSMYSIALRTFNGDKCDLIKSELSFEKYGVAYAATWSDDAERFAVVTKDNQLHVLNEDLSEAVAPVSIKSGASSITSDDKYIYISYKASGTVPVDVYNWNGEKVGSFNITGFGMGEDVSYNVQSIFFHNGKMHATVCSWTTGYQAYFDWVVDIDQSILN